MLVITMIPIASLLNKGGKNIEQRHLYTETLHDELQIVLWGSSLELPLLYEKEIDASKIKLSFIMEGEFVKGCANWENAKNKTETTCLFGYMPK